MNYTSITVSLIALFGDFCIDDCASMSVYPHRFRPVADFTDRTRILHKGFPTKGNPRPEIASPTINPLDNGGCRGSLSESFA
jgi:hypothetical protein